MSKVVITPAQHILILGKTGSWKSIAPKRVFIPQLMQQKKGYLVILDPKREYHDVTDVVAHNPRELNEMLYKEDKPVAKIIRAVSPEANEEAAEEYLLAAWGPTTANYDQESYNPHFSVRFLLEDMPTWYDSSYKTPRQLRNWVTMGRAYERTVIGTTQRAQLIPKTLFTMVDHVFVFRISEYDRKNTIREYYGTESEARVASLEGFDYALLSDLFDHPVIFKAYTGKQIPKGAIGIELSDEYE